MPEISRFYGIVIRVFFNDHPPPHFHALYGESEVLISIDNLAVIAGGLPPRALGMVTEWALLHHDELKSVWRKAKNLQLPGRIDPLP